jgi:hypothetical protein
MMDIKNKRPNTLQGILPEFEASSCVKLEKLAETHSDHPSVEIGGNLWMWLLSISYFKKPHSCVIIHHNRMIFEL